MTLTVFPWLQSTMASVSRGDCSYGSLATSDDYVAVTSTESPKQDVANKQENSDSTPLLVSIELPSTSLVVLPGSHTLWSAAGNAIKGKPQQVQKGDNNSNVPSDPLNDFNYTDCKYLLHDPGSDLGAKGGDCVLSGMLRELHARQNSTIYPTASPTITPMNRSIFDDSSTRASDETASSATGIPAIVIALVALCTTLLLFFCILSSDGCEKRRTLFAPVRPTTDSQTEDLDESEA